MDEDLANLQWISPTERFLPPKRSLEPAIDIPVSKVVGKTIYQHDPRLLKLIVKWKGNKPLDSTQPDDYLRNPAKIAELKKVLSQSI